MDKYGLPENRIFSSSSPSFKDGILRRTNGKGVDVVLNSLAGEQLKASFECIANFGRFVEIGKSDMYKRSRLTYAYFDKGISLTAVDFLLIHRDRPLIAYETLKAVFELFENGSLSVATPITRYSIGDVESAFRLIAGRKHIGKLVLVSDGDQQVQATPRPPQPLRLSSEGTYVVVGGLGDLGRIACTLLAKGGAGHIVTLSRTLPVEEELDAFRRTLSEQGPSVLHTLICDVTDRDAVLRVAASLRNEKPPVLGVIHSGLALNVSQNMANYICIGQKYVQQLD